MKLIFKINFMVFMIIMLTGCLSTEKVGKAGELPNKWWTMNEGNIQNYYRQDAKGAQKAVIIFVGFSDDPTNLNESTAFEAATMDAKLQLSSFLTDKFTALAQQKKYAQGAIEVIDKAIKDRKITEDEGKVLNAQLNVVMKNYYADITTTQFSSFKRLGKHAEKNGALYKAWVCYSITDEVLTQTKDLQLKAFETLMEASDKYKEILKQINEITAQKMLEVLTDEANFQL